MLDGLGLETRSATCTTTTSRPTASARCAACAAPIRRDIGHGALAERALVAVLPDQQTFPYVDARRLRSAVVQRLVLDG